MRTPTIIGSTVLVLGMLTGGAMAASPASAPDALSGSWGGTTCAQFTQMDTTAQANIITQIGQQNPQGSLTSNSGSGGTTNSTNANGTMAANANASEQNNANVVPGTPLSSGQLIAACQAASPSTTLQDAYSHSQSGTNDGSGK